MTLLERCENHLRFGEFGHYVESNDGSIRITRAERFVDTLPSCYITENGVSRYVDYSEAREILRKMVEEEAQNG